MTPAGMLKFPLKVPHRAPLKGPGLNAGGDIRSVPPEESGPVLQGAFASLCGVCLTAPPKYSCPRCSMQYCGLTCFKRHGDECSEKFYQKQVMEAIAARPVSAKMRNEMARILKRTQQEADAFQEKLDSMFSDETGADQGVGGEHSPLEDLHLASTASGRLEEKCDRASEERSDGDEDEDEDEDNDFDLGEDESKVIKDFLEQLKNLRMSEEQQGEKSSLIDVPNEQLGSAGKSASTTLSQETKVELVQAGKEEDADAQADTEGEPDEEFEQLLSLLKTTDQELDPAALPKPILRKFRKYLMSKVTPTVQQWHPWWLPLEDRPVVSSQELCMKNIRDRFLARANHDNPLVWKLPVPPPVIEKLYASVKRVGSIIEEDSQQQTSQPTEDLLESLARTAGHGSLPPSLKCTREILLQMVDTVTAYCYVMRLFNGDIGVPFTSHSDTEDGENMHDLQIAESAFDYLLSVSSALHTGMTGEIDERAAALAGEPADVALSASVSHILDRILTSTSQSQGIKYSRKVLAENIMVALTDAASVLYSWAKLTLVMTHLIALVNFLIHSVKHPGTRHPKIDINTASVKELTTGAAASANENREKFSGKLRFQPYSPEVRKAIRSQLLPIDAPEARSSRHSIFACRRLLKKLDLFVALMRDAIEGKRQLPHLVFVADPQRSPSWRQVSVAAGNLPLNGRLVILQDRATEIQRQLTGGKAQSAAAAASHSDSHDSVNSSDCSSADAPLSEYNSIMLASIAESLIVEWKRYVVKLYDLDEAVLQDGPTP